MKCPFCGRVLSEEKGFFGKENELYCEGCGRSMEPVRALRRMSARYYNEGLADAGQHRLEHARIALEKAVRYYGQNTDALNLLGLVRLEVGEIGEAIICWSKSAAADPSADNPAVEYLHKAERSMGKASAMRESIRLYNDSLALLARGQNDTAYLHLRKALTQNDHYVRARELMALCMIRDHQFDRARQLLKEVGTIHAEDPELPYYTAMLSKERQAWEASAEGKELRQEQLEQQKAEEVHSQQLQLQQRQQESQKQAVPAGLSHKSLPSVRTLLRQNSMVVQGVLYFLGILTGILLARFF